MRIPAAFSTWSTICVLNPIFSLWSVERPGKSQSSFLPFIRTGRKSKTYSSINFVSLSLKANCSARLFLTSNFGNWSQQLLSGPPGLIKFTSSRMAARLPRRTGATSRIPTATAVCARSPARTGAELHMSRACSINRSGSLANRPHTPGVKTARITTRFFSVIRQVVEAPSSHAGQLIQPAFGSAEFVERFGSESRQEVWLPLAYNFQHCHRLLGEVYHMGLGILCS